ncbi:Na(+)/H(+) antiporter NhaA, partial [Streptomyces sp. NPDC005568]
FGSLIAAVLASVLLKLRNAKYRGLCEEEDRDEDQDGIPDIYELDNPEYHLRMAAIHEGKAAEHRRLAAEMEAERRALAEVTGGAGEENAGPA